MLVIDEGRRKIRHQPGVSMQQVVGVAVGTVRSFRRFAGCGSSSPVSLGFTADLSTQVLVPPLLSSLPRIRIAAPCQTGWTRGTSRGA
jgi:hypothetical protein